MSQPTINPAPTLLLADGEEIHCGQENNLLRHIVEQLFVDFAGSKNEYETESDDTWLPLVLYGESLCGKSIVAHGLANAWKQKYPKQKTIVLTSADLARSLSKTALADDIDRLNRQLKSAALLVLDDIQQLVGKKNADAWFVGVLDYRGRHRKATIVTCNTNLAGCRVSDRLRSRLTSGLSVCISLPYAETRKDVILKSARTFDLSLVDEKVDQLVELTNGQPVSGIQSVVASVASHDEIDPSENNSEEERQEFIHKLVRTTSRRFGIRVSDIKGSSRRKNTVLSRAIAMFLLREFTPMSLVEVGGVFGGRDHSTVRHACEKIKKQIVDDEPVREAISSICRSLDIRLPSSWFDRLDEQCA